MFPSPVIAVCSSYSLLHLCFVFFFSHCADSMALECLLHSKKCSRIFRSYFILAMLPRRNGLPLRLHRIE